MTTDHIEDVRGRSMADAAVGPCDCDPHIEHCPSCAPYLHEPLKPAGEEDKATYKQIADNYTHPSGCPRCAELADQLQFQSSLTKELLPYQDEAVQSRAKLAALEAEIERKMAAGQVVLDRNAELEAEVKRLKTVPMKYRRMEFNAQLQATIAQQAKRIKELETKLTLFVSRG